MFDRAKKALVESYVGAIALGYMFAQGVLHFVNIFASPVATWVSRRQYSGLVPGASVPAGFPWDASLPEAIRFFLLSFVWSLLLHWLYFKPLNAQSSQPDTSGREGG